MGGRDLPKPCMCVFVVERLEEYPLGSVEADRILPYL